jgi:tetratricopeptide (TPR) repeat protein
MLDIEKAYKLYSDYKKTGNRELLSKIEELIKGDSSIQGLNLLALVYIEKGKYDDAINALDIALKKVKDDEDKATLLFNKALALFRKGDLDSSYEILKSIPSRTSVYAHSRRFLAQVCIKKGDLRHLEEARQILESFDIPNEDLAVTYILLSRLKDKSLYKKAVEIAKSIKNEKLLAEALLSSDDEKELEVALEIFRKLNDVNGEAKVLYKLSLKKPELLYEAIQRLEESGESRERQTLLYELYKRTGILNFLKEAIKIAEKYNDYLFLARSYVELSKKENELENLRKAVLFYEKYVESL